MCWPRRAACAAAAVTAAPRGCKSQRKACARRVQRVRSRQSANLPPQGPHCHGTAGFGSTNRTSPLPHRAQLADENTFTVPSRWGPDPWTLALAAARGCTHPLHMRMHLRADPSPPRYRRSHACVHAHVHTHTRTHTRAHAHTHTHTHAHTHTNTHTHTRAHTHVCSTHATPPPQGGPRFRRAPGGAAGGRVAAPARGDAAARRHAAPCHAAAQPGGRARRAVRVGAAPGERLPGPGARAQRGGPARGRPVTRRAPPRSFVRGLGGCQIPRLVAPPACCPRGLSKRSPLSVAGTRSKGRRLPLPQAFSCPRVCTKPPDPAPRRCSRTRGARRTCRRWRWGHSGSCLFTAMTSPLGPRLCKPCRLSW